MEFIKIGDRTVYYDHQPGQSKDQVCLLYIHGSGATHELWTRQIDLGLNSFALDLPGHGQSEGAASSSIDQSAQTVADFISTLPLPQPVYLIGHSMGAAIALTCALNYPAMIKGLVLIGAGQRMKVMPSFLEDLQQGKNDPEFIRLGFSPHAPAPLADGMVKIFGAVQPSVLYADFLACDNFDITGRLEKIETPVLLISGADDRLTPLKLSQYLQTHLNNCRLEVISEAGHFTMLEKPEVINQLIINFCR
ncbi:MAG: alpha/beta hydrolase [Syntrophomonadaceae bacterium]|nr:alpha/beta hydrolase [Syntrophomonadaceae bacterium]